MKRGRWVAQLGVSFLVVTILARGAWSAPTGAANVPQIQFFELADPDSGNTQRIFRTTDPIRFRAVYHDPLPACDGVAPTFVQLFVFTAEGRFIGQFDGTSFAAFGPQSREIGGALAIGALAIGTYKFTFLVRDCTNSKSVVQPELISFRVIAP